MKAAHKKTVQNHMVLHSFFMWGELKRFLANYLTGLPESSQQIHRACCMCLMIENRSAIEISLTINDQLDGSPSLVLNGHIRELRHNKNVDAIIF